MSTWKNVRLLKHGEVAGSATAKQLPTIGVGGLNTPFLVNIKAEASNAGKVYLGLSNAVTKADGTTNETAGWELGAGDETGMIPVASLDSLWIICDNAGDDILYFIYG